MGKAGPVTIQHVTEAIRKQKAVDDTFNRLIAQMGERFHASAPLYRQHAHLQWAVFKLTVFAPYEDVGLEERAIRVPLFIL